MSTERPDGWDYWYRVVDAQHQGWHPTGSEDGAAIYAADYGFQRDLENRSLAELERDRGPLRPVLLITGEDERALRDALAMADQKAVTSLASAVWVVFTGLRAFHGGHQDPASFEAARRHLLAGREGSWESEGLMNLAIWGSGLKQSRVRARAVEAFAYVLLRWVTDPGRFTEMAETLAGVVSRYADEHGGWPSVADQWLQPGALDQEGVHVTYSLLYSHGKDFDPDVLR